MSAFQNHPFAVEAYFKSSVVLTYAVEKEFLEQLVPKPLELDLFEDRWAFIAVAMVETKQLRPEIMPAFMGTDFFLIGYRIFVTYTTEAGKRLRGLYILKSETDRSKMTLLGNFFTKYRYETIDINRSQSGDLSAIQSKKATIEVLFDTSNPTPELPKLSPFSDWKQARRFAGPLPFTFSVDNSKKEIIIVKGSRQNWKPEPVEIISETIGFLERFLPQKPFLASAFQVTDIPYRWEKGVSETCT